MTTRQRLRDYKLARRRLLAVQEHAATLGLRRLNLEYRREALLIIENAQRAIERVDRRIAVLTIEKQSTWWRLLWLRWKYR